MNPDTIFNITCLFAALGWIILIVFSPFWKGFDKFVLGVVIALLALVYTWLNFSNFSPEIMKDFSSLEGVATLYQNKELLTASWAHFLVFDLLGAVWMKKNSLKYRIAHWLMIPVFILTCMFGPFGYLLYLLVRWAKTKIYFSENF